MGITFCLYCTEMGDRMVRMSHPPTFADRRVRTSKSHSSKSHSQGKSHKSQEKSLSLTGHSPLSVSSNQATAVIKSGKNRKLI